MSGNYPDNVTVSDISRAAEGVYGGDGLRSFDDLSNLRQTELLEDFQADALDLSDALYNREGDVKLGAIVNSQWRGFLKAKGIKP